MSPSTQLSSQFIPEPYLLLTPFPVIPGEKPGSDLRGWAFLFLSQPATVTKLRALLTSSFLLSFVVPFFNATGVKHLLSAREVRILNSRLGCSNKPWNPHSSAWQKFISRSCKVPCVGRGSLPTSDSGIQDLSILN